MEDRITQPKIFKNEQQYSKSFLDILVNEVPFEYKLKRYRSGKHSVESIPYEIDDCHKFRNSVYIHERKVDEKKKISQKKPENQDEFQNIDNIHPIDIIKWENEIFDVDKDDDCNLYMQVSEKIIPNRFNNAVSSNRLTVEIKEYVSKLLESNWEKNIIYDKVCDQKPMTIFIDDPNLIFESIDKQQKIKKKPIKNGNLEKPIKNKYNISNDKYYDSEVKSKTSLVSFGVQHSIPALKLNSQFYRINHTKEELRNFHKPPLVMPNKKYLFYKTVRFDDSPLGNSVNASNTFIRKPYELTCNDSAEIVIFEYSEEHPFFIVNPGMVSLLNRYYRKIDNQDDLTPKDCIILEPDDEGPFMGYGNVPFGNTMNTIDNNLFVAPVFMHKAQNDYLCIITENKLIVRKINKVWLVGQELPKEEVYAPHSRKLNQFCKNRLKVAAYRIYNKKEDLTMEQLDEVMPYFSEGSKRKWLKEYSDTIKRGKDNIYIPKENCNMMNEEDLRKLVMPENICQYESMLAEERRMEDLGYKILEDEGDYEYTPSWVLSRNFVNSTNGKGLLELRGKSDPTGVGEGFSFGKVRFKKNSETENRRMLSEHQAQYKSEIAKIWNSHIESLSKKYENGKLRHNLDPYGLIKNGHFPIPSEGQDESTKALKKHKSGELSNDMVDESNCLTIKRTYLENGKEVVRSIKVYDPKVVKAYLLAKKKYKSEEKKTSLTCSNCGQSGHMKTNKNCPKYQGVKKITGKTPKEILQEKLLKLMAQLTNIPFSSPFHRPVSNKKFPTYATIITRPIDFLQIRNNIKNNLYSSYGDFLFDLEQIYENCKVFNGPVHSLTEVAKEIYDQGSNYRILNFDELNDLEMRIQMNESEIDSQNQ